MCWLAPAVLRGDRVACSLRLQYPARKQCLRLQLLLSIHHTSTTPAATQTRQGGILLAHYITHIWALLLGATSSGGRSPARVQMNPPTLNPDHTARLHTATHSLCGHTTPCPPSTHPTQRTHPTATSYHTSL